MYRRIGEIRTFKDIPWDKPIIVTGGIGWCGAWCQRMPGIFRKDNDDFRFVNDFGMSTRFNKNDFISLNILEEIDR